MTDTKAIITGLEQARDLIRCNYESFVSCAHTPGIGLSPVDQQVADDFVAAIDVTAAAAGELQRLEAERDALADALHKARSSVQWRDGRLNQLQIAQVRMRDPERMMVCDILANGALLKPEGSRYAAPQPAAEPVAPTGWKLVPVEPTPEMLSAHSLGRSRVMPACAGAEEKANTLVSERYRAMLAAAPQPPAADHPEDALEMVRPPAVEPLPTIRTGRYRHYKGGEYRVLGVARHSESLEPMVLYRSLDSDGGDWMRPFWMFFGTVEHEGKSVPRFELLEDGPARQSEPGLARCASGGILGRQCGEYRADTGLCGLPAKLGACVHREGGAA